MKILLAGYNIDKTLLDTISLEGSAVTPETLSAAYARISRDPRAIPELRKDALEDVAKARKSNKTIVFGLGHSSVAEHAVFNFDILDVSRLAVESIQSHRLNSYTEKSQRYIEIGKDYVMPEEIVKIGLETEFENFTSSMFDAYNKFYKVLIEYFFDLYPDVHKLKAEKRRVEGLAKEDARYILPMAVTSQFGMTINARNLEYLIKRLADEELEELKQISKELYNLTADIAPSIIKYTDPTEYNPSIWRNKQSFDAIVDTSENADVSLIDITDNAETKIIAGLIFRENGSWEDALKQAAQMNEQEKVNIISQRLQGMQPWDKVPREFELAELTFELIASSTCFAQIKRHRMATILTSEYIPALGVTVPESIINTGLDAEFKEAIKESEVIYNNILEQNKTVAPYVLLNAHRRKVLIKMNARELYHYSRLREDEHAQWDIRYLAEKMMNTAKEKMPAVFKFACGKHDFPKNGLI